MLNIYFSRENLDKEKFIFSSLNGRTLILVPDQYTLEAEREAFRHLGVSALMDVEILSPSRLGSHVLKELGGGRRRFIDKYGRHMLLYKSACRKSDDLQVFRGMEKKSSFLESVNNFISEMKQYDCGAEDLKTMADSLEQDSYTARKLMDIYAIFADYEEQIRGKYTDSEDYVDLYLERIGRSRLVKGSRVWVYGFDSFAPKAMALLGKLMTAAEELNLVMTWDGAADVLGRTASGSRGGAYSGRDGKIGGRGGTTSGGRDRELFELPGIVMHNAEQLADSLGVAHRRIAIPEEFAFSGKAAAIKHIERELYAIPSVKSRDSGGLTLVEAANIYNEAESAASYVLHLVRDKGLRYRDIKVICNDMESRGEALARVFREYGIEVFTDAKKDIMSNAVVQTVTSLLDVVIEKYRTESVLTLLKSGFGDLTGEELADLENYSIKYKVKGTMWKKPFRRGKGEYGEQGLERIETLRKRAVGNIAPLEELLKVSDMGSFIEGFYKYLRDEARLPEKIASFAAEQEEKGFAEFADETRQVWDSLMMILEQIYEIMGADEMDAEAFRDIFTAGLSEVEIGQIPPSEDGLMIGNMQRSRSGRMKALVVVGANEGVIPQEKPSQGIFSAEERDVFQSGGKELCKVDSVRFMEEKTAIYKNLSAPSDYLWVSFSASDIEGSQTKPSKIFLKLKELFPDLEAEKDVLNDGDSSKLINGGISGVRHLTEALQAVGEGQPLSREWSQVLSWVRKNQPDRIEKVRRGISFTNRQEDLGRAAADALFRRETDETLTLSPSRLEKFARCPFSHLVAYGLKPEERRIYEAAPREIGDIYHRCLMEVTRELTMDGVEITAPESPWMKITRRQCEELVDRKIGEIADSYRDGLFNDGNVEVYRGERALEICRQVCWTMVEQVRAGSIKSIMPEVSFSRKGSLPPVEVKLPDRNVLIEGIIDRVDYLSDDRVKIIDYKTGNETFDTEEAAKGYRLQLMLYLQAACGQEGGSAGNSEVEARKPAGVFYFKIKEPAVDFSQKEIDAGTLEKEIRKAFRLDGVMVDDPQVIKDIAGEFSGFSEIAPVKNTKEGVKSAGREGLLSEEEFAALREAVAAKVEEACMQLSEGKIDVYPMKTKERSACTFCRYKGICRFDTVFEGCSYNIIS